MPGMDGLHLYRYLTRLRPRTVTRIIMAYVAGSLQGGNRVMLVLTRGIGERIVIADDICLTVLVVTGRKVRIGITAPSSVPVARLELLRGCSGGTAAPTAGRRGKGRERGGASRGSAS
jgi:carbon storage regulator